ncbi:FRIGIDA-like protein 1 [Punica granatum]|uniref:FRIGIDA-like protein 1 n=2 Tax=Punica granatum TaxID=22663 RepID=A0A6P8EEQ3_PUNGR|nr:FRIGIDA-like protein 1 [Punica granatum]PKI77477.1 hypothetical protein CRG98_002083 [Punica granatum]
MEAVQSIGEAIELIDAKKEGLKKAYDDLQASFPSVLPSFSLTWSDLDSHFTSLRDSLTQRLRLLESLESGRQTQQDGCGIAGTCPPAPSDQPNVDAVDSAPARPGSGFSADQVPPEATAELASGNDPPQSSKPPSADRDDSVPARLGLDSSPNAEAQAEFPSASHQEQNPALEANPLTSPALVSEAGVFTGPAHPESNPSPLPRSRDAPEPSAVEPRPEVKAFCSKVDGGGLIKYVIDHANERGAIRAQLALEIRNCPDPAKLILDAMGGFHQTEKAKEDTSLLKPTKIKTMRSSCIFLLEVLMSVSPHLTDRAKRRAKGLALMWKKRTQKDASNHAQILGFLLMVAAFGLGSEFSFEDLAEYFVIVAASNRAPELCRRIGLGDGIPDLIQKLTRERKELLAVRFIFDLGMNEKFPPVPILKTHLDRLKEFTEKVCEDRKKSPQSQREAIDREIKALESVVKIIEDRKLVGEYPKQELHDRIQQLDKLKAEKKWAARAQEPQNTQVSRNKRPRANPAGFVPQLGSSSAPYGFVDPASVGAPFSYPAASVRHYGFPGAAPPRPHLYQPEWRGPSLYRNAPLPPDYGGYGISPQHNSPYYPY